MEKKENLRRAFKELSEILKYIPKEEYDKIPNNFLNLMENVKDENYKFSFNPDVNLEKQELLKETEILLGILFLKYWANEQEKQEAYRKLDENEQKYIQEQNEKYSIDNIFKKPESVSEPQEEAQIQESNLPVEYHEGIWNKIVGFLKRIFKIKRN